MSRPRTRLVVLFACATAAGAALWTAGSGRAFGGPPEASWHGVQAWYVQAGPGAVAVAGVRWIGLLATAWLGTAAVVQLVATAAAGSAVRHVADAVTPRVVRRLTHGVASLSVAVALVGPSAPRDPVGTAVMERVDPAPTTTTPSTTKTSTPSTTAVSPSPTPPASPPARPGPTPVVVAPGDSFWSLAEAAVAAHPSSPAVGDYWRRFVAANRPRLVDPDNPDLLYPGQTLTLPPLHG
jgi:hypothetical protein